MSTTITPTALSSQAQKDRAAHDTARLAAQGATPDTFAVDAMALKIALRNVDAANVTVKAHRGQASSADHKARLARIEAGRLAVTMGTARTAAVLAYIAADDAGFKVPSKSTVSRMTSLASLVDALGNRKMDVTDDEKALKSTETLIALAGAARIAAVVTAVADTEGETLAERVGAVVARERVAREAEKANTVKARNERAEEVAAYLDGLTTREGLTPAEKRVLARLVQADTEAVTE